MNIFFDFVYGNMHISIYLYMHIILRLVYACIHIYIYPISSKQVQVSTTTVYIYMYIIGISVIIVITMGNILIGTTNILNYIDTYKKIMNWWIDLRRVFRLFKNHRKCTCLRFLQHKSHQVCYFIPGSSGPKYGNNMKHLTKELPSRELLNPISRHFWR